MIRINTSEIRQACARLRAGDKVLLSGKVYTARDAAHKKIFKIFRDNPEQMPFELRDSIIAYIGPTQARPENPIGSCGPTTSSRMDPYAPALYEAGMAACIGKGDRSPAVYEAIKKSGGVYFAAIGGAGALYAEHVRSVKVIAYEELGCESVKELEIVDFPLYVAIDSFGGSIFPEHEV